MGGQWLLLSWSRRYVLVRRIDLSRRLMCLSPRAGGTETTAPDPEEGKHDGGGTAEGDGMGNEGMTWGTTAGAWVTSSKTSGYCLASVIPFGSCRMASSISSTRPGTRSGQSEVACWRILARANLNNPTNSRLPSMLIPKASDRARRLRWGRLESLQNANQRWTHREDSQSHDPAMRRRGVRYLCQQDLAQFQHRHVLLLQV